MSALSRTLAVGVIGAAVGLACGSDFSSEFDEGGASSSGASNGSSSGFGSSGASGGDGDGSTTDSGDPSDADLNADSACAQANAQATLKPLDMFIMFDRSISMGPGDCDVGGNTASPWCYAINALATYLKGTSATGNAASLQFFGQGGGPATSNTCATGAGFDVSVVPGGATGYTNLPSTAFDAALNAANPDQYTPLEPAIRGITAFTGNATNKRAGRTTIGILITDASTPLDCSTNWTTMAGLLSAHATASGVKTYVIGMNGANFTNLETLAVAGGGPSHADAVGAATDACGNGNGPCHHWNAGDGTTSAPLVEALKQIQGLAVGCTFTIPAPSAGTIDFNQVKVEYLPNGQTPAQQLAKVNDAAGCSGAGWYYDDNTTPTSVSLCPSSCTTVQADANAKLNVLFGCVKPSSSSSSSSSGGVN
jgi:hypothetical protein